MLHVKLINVDLMLVGNVGFFSLSRGSHNILSISRSFEECVERWFTNTTF